MSYCRVGKDSDLYLVRDMDDKKYHCVACRLTGGEHDVVMLPDHVPNVLAHVSEHLANNHKVPRRVFDRLLNEHFGAK